MISAAGTSVSLVGAKTKGVGAGSGFGRAIAQRLPEGDLDPARAS